MVQLMTEHHEDVDFNQVCIFDSQIPARPTAFTATAELDISDLTISQRRTLKIATFWDLESNLD